MIYKCLKSFQKVFKIKSSIGVGEKEPRGLLRGSLTWSQFLCDPGEGMTSQNTSPSGNIPQQKLLIRIHCNEEGASKSIVTVQLDLGDSGTRTEIKVSSTPKSDLGANKMAETVISIQRTSNNQDTCRQKRFFITKPNLAKPNLQRSFFKCF